MKFNKKQLMLGLLFVALASRMYAADDNALIAQAREFAQKLAQYGNIDGRDLVHRLVERVQHLMPLSVQVGEQAQRIDEQAQRITSLEAQAMQAQQQRAALLNVLGVQAPVVMPVASAAPISASPVALEESSTTIGSSSSSSSSSSSFSSSSQPILIDDAPEVASGLSTESTAPSVASSEPVAPIASLERVWELFHAQRFEEALEVAKAIASDSAQRPVNRAWSLACIGAIYFEGGNGVERNYARALKHLEDAIKMRELPAFDRAMSLARIGYIYYRGGNGVERNHARALGYYEDAIKMRELPAFDRAMSLGRIGEIYYRAGNGVERNYATALKYYEDAIKMRELPAVDRAMSLINIGEIYRVGGNGVERNYATALRYYRDVLNMRELPPLPCAHSLGSIGDIYFQGGNGVERNYVTALRYYKGALAVKNGLNPSRKANVEAQIAKTRSEQQRLIASRSSSSSSSSSSSQPVLIDLTDDASVARPNKRAERTASAASLQKDVASSKRARTADHRCDVCSKSYTSRRSLKQHERKSRTHRRNLSEQQPVVLPPSTRLPHAPLRMSATVLSDLPTPGEQNDSSELAPVSNELSDDSELLSDGKNN